MTRQQWLGSFSRTMVFAALFCFWTITAHGKVVSDIDRLTALEKQDQDLLKRAAEHPDTGILVTDDQGRRLFSKNPDVPYVPASILKILTSLAALSQWGENHRFTTLAGYDPDSGILYIKGLGDPLFVSEVIRNFSQQLVENFGMQEVKGIVIDQSHFSPEISIPGTGQSLNPYDATTGALCANFNTIHFTWDATERTFVSAESQTPLLALFIPDIRDTGLKQGRILLNTEERYRYPGLLLTHFLEKLGVHVTGPVKTGSVPDSVLKKSPDSPFTLLSLSSPWTLEEVVAKLLKYSNNFIANQVMLALGAHIHGPPATLDKGIRVLSDCAASLPDWETARMAEGSGLSRLNRITPSQMGQLLLAFMPYHQLLQRSDTQYYKTGTLTGVRTRAGYFIGTDQRLYPFVIMK